MTELKLAFLDTNILVYQFDRDNKIKQKKSQVLIEQLLKNNQAVISSQVMQEFVNVSLKKFKTTILPEELEMFMTDILKPLCQHFPSYDFYKRAIKLFRAYSLNYYDALILQAAIDLGCQTLYSEDLQDGQKFGGLTIVNPFR